MTEQEASTEASQVWPLRWRIDSVRGRGSTREKGLATARSMSLRDANGSPISVQRLTRDGDPGITVDFIAVAKRMTFDRCPICLTPDPATDEHIPPKSIGGSVMTSTCKDCNNGFGSVLENALTGGWEDAVGSVSFSHPAVPGRRKTDRILLRQTDAGAPVLILDRGRIDPAITQHMLPGSAVDLAYRPPDPDRYRLAALKSAYLGACLLIRSIPDTPEAVSIRDELMRVRNLPRRVSPGPSSLCSGLTVAKSYGPAKPGEVALVRTRSQNDDEAAEYAILLARTLLVTWPIGGYLATADEDGNPLSAERLGPAMPG